MCLNMTFLSKVMWLQRSCSPSSSRRMSAAHAMIKTHRRCDSQMNREVEFQQELYFLLRKTIESEPEISGFRFSRVEMEYQVDGGKSDIVIFDEKNKPFIVIETKRKNGRMSRNIDPLSFNVIKQALGYAGILGASFIATANASFFASFTAPPHGEAFSIERHRVLITQIQVLNTEFVKQFLEKVVKYHYAITYEEKNKIATGLDWTFIFRLRSFVTWLSVEIEQTLKSRLELDERFRRIVSEFEQDKGVKLSARSLAQEMSYILTNKILFYKVLERKYPTLPKLLDISVPRARLYLTALYRLFDEAVAATKDFEAVFKTGLFDEIVLPQQSAALLDILDGLKTFVKDMEMYQLEQLDADVIGHVYEELLQPEERHRLGQFYTPPAIAELICKWAIRDQRDLVLDPAAGSGTFPVKSYQILRGLKMLESPTKSLNETHAENIKQLYTIDINPFPAHLTAMNLAMRNVNHPISEMNVLREDFFKVSPNQIVLSPYAIKTAQGEEYREIKIPIVDVVVGNPPYTRWTELSDEARSSIKRAIGSELSEFRLVAGSTQSEPMIYLHFLIHGAQFLRNDGRLGMIISNSWLQADYGVKFGKYLLSNFRVIAVIDFSPRVFRVPLIATLVLLLERETDPERRRQNKTFYVFVDKAEGLTTEKLLNLIEDSTEKSGLLTNSLEQQKLDSGAKWLNVLFGSDEILQRLQAAQNTVAAADMFTIATSNAGWAYWALKHGSRTNIGSKQFFYLTSDDVRTKGLQGYARRAICSARSTKFYTFGKEDWKALDRKKSPTYFFMCQKPVKEVPPSVRRYVHWGETVCRTGIRESRGGGAICSKAYTCQVRQKTPQRFKGWYDLGGFKYTPIMAVYQSRYRTRFFWCKEKFVAYHAIVTFLPKGKLTETELKAELAFLNSSFSHLYVESEGRAVSVGPIALEVAQAERMPILNVRKLPNETVQELARLFDELESATRKLGGADTKENLDKLAPYFEKIDDAIAKTLNLPKDLGRKARDLALCLMERRLLGVTERVTLRGQEPELIYPPSRKVRVRREEQVPPVTLDQWTKNSKTP